MQIDIYTEGADSLVENPESAIFREYFGGTFMSARTVIEELNEHGDVSVHIIDDNHGYVRGSKPIDAVAGEDVDRESAVQEFSSNLLQSARDADVLVVMLSKAAFLDIVVPQWDVLSNLTNPACIWCLASSQKALSHIEVEECLEQNVIVYHRSGVARIGIDAKDALVDSIEQQKNTRSKEGVYREFGGGFGARELLKSGSVEIPSK